MKIPPESLSFEYFRASGPGGQNVNKVSTAVRLRFDVDAANLSPRVEARLARLAGNKLTAENVLIIEASRFRTRARNQADAYARLEELLERASTFPRKRRKTRPTRASERRRLAEKKRRGELKKSRGKVRRDE